VGARARVHAPDDGAARDAARPRLAARGVDRGPGRRVAAALPLAPRPAARFTVVEIDEQVVAVARQSFKLPDDERIRLVVGDAVDEVPSLAGSFDLVLIDGFDARSAGRLDSVPFYAACRERLAPGGFLSVNLLRARAA
jgi:spermidine synthase